MTDQQTPFEAALAAATMTVFEAGPNPARMKLHAGDCGAVKRANYVSEPYEESAAVVHAAWSTGRRAHDCAGRAAYAAAMKLIDSAARS